MSYQAEISRANPSCFVFLIDQSLSMSELIGGEAAISKKDVVADALNRLLTELAIRCAKEGGLRNYFHVSVLGYGDGRAESVFRGPLAGRDLIPIKDIAENPLRIEQRARREPDGVGGVIELKTDFPIWVEPSAGGNTPMCQALNSASSLIRNWLSQHPSTFPPVVLNLTDGEANDGDPVTPAEQLRVMGTEDGRVLLFNLHVSAASMSPITFPDSDAGLPDAYARMLFGMSSPLPPPMRNYAAHQGHAVSESTRGFVYNADIVSIVQFLDIGTRLLPVQAQAR